MRIPFTFGLAALLALVPLLQGCALGWFAGGAATGAAAHEAAEDDEIEIDD